MTDKYINFEEFRSAYPFLGHEHYDALRQHKYVLCLNDSDITIHDDMTKLRQVMGHNKTPQVWNSAVLLRRKRAAVVTRIDDDESPAFTVHYHLSRMGWVYETNESGARFIVDTGATHTIIRIPTEEYNKINAPEGVVGGAVGVFQCKPVNGVLHLGADVYPGQVLVSCTCEFNLFGMDFIRDATLVFCQGRLALSPNEAI